MRRSRRPALPLLPLLRAYAGAGLPSADDLVRLPALGPRFGAILSARTGLLSETFLDGAAPDDFQAALLRFYEATVQPPLHAAVLSRRAGMVRHALAHLLHSPDPWPQKAERCLGADGPYHVAGLGPAFWTALFQALDPARQAGWTPATVVGLRRLGLARWPAHAAAAEVHAGLLKGHAHIRAREPGLTGPHIDHFLTLAALMQGRDLWSGARRLETAGAGIDLEAVIRQERDAATSAPATEGARPGAGAGACGDRGGAGVPGWRPARRRPGRGRPRQRETALRSTGRLTARR